MNPDPSGSRQPIRAHSQAVAPDERPSGQRLVLNGFKVTFSSDNVDVFVESVPDNKAVRGLRERFGEEWFLSWRDGNLYGIPKVASRSPFGTKQTIKCTDNLQLLISRLENLLPERFPQYQALRYRPFSFAGRKGELVETVSPRLGKVPALLQRFQIHPSFELEAKIVEPAPGDAFIGLFFGVKTRWRISASLQELQDAGVDLRGLAVIRRQKAPGERSLVGTIRELRNGVVSLAESFDDLTEIAADAVSIEGSKSSFGRCLRPILGSQYQRFDDELRAAEARLLTGPALDDALRKMEGLLRRNPTFALTDALSCTIGSRIELANSAEYRSVTLVSPVQYCFDAARSKQSQYAWPGLRQHGPFSRSTFSNRSPKILVVYPDVAQGPTEKFIRYLKEGVGNQFPGGFAQLFALVNPSFDECKVSLVQSRSGATGKAYSDAIQTKLSASQDPPDVAIVVLTDEHGQLPDPDGPYIQSKAMLMMQGIPTQQVLLSRLRQSENSLQYILQNLALALYAKLNGTPWTVDQDKTIADELVIGIGTAEVGASRFHKRERYVGITTVFRGDGNYLLSHVSRECSFDDYPRVLEESTVAILQDIKNRNGWMPGDKIRVIFHAYKPLKKVEVAQITKRCVATVGSDQEIEFAFVTVTLEHPFRTLDMNQQGVPTRHGGNKGVLAPDRGTICQIGRFTRLLSTNGPTLIKMERAPLPSPLLVHLHEASDFKDLTYLSEQVLKFTSLSWRSTLPAQKPVSIYYSELIAKLLARLRTVPAWSTAVLSNHRLRASRWFL